MTVTQQDFEHGRRAKEKLDILIKREFEPLLRTVTRNPKLEVVSHAGAPMTSGTKVWLQIPWKLGETQEHNAAECNLYDSRTGLSLCPACYITDEVRTDMWHESAHITEQSFQKMEGWQTWECLMSNFDSEFQLLEQSKFEEIRRKVTLTRNPLEAIKYVDKWLPTSWNAIEDVYVNRRIYEARPGVELPMTATTKSAFTEAMIDPLTGEAVKRGPDMDALMVPYLIGHGLGADPECRATFGPDHVKLFDDVVLNEIIDAIPSDCDVTVRIGLAGRLLTRLRELGYLPRPTDSVLPPPPPPPPQEEAETEQSSPSNEESESQDSEPGKGASEDESDSEEDSDESEAGENGEESDPEESGDTQQDGSDGNSDDETEDDEGSDAGGDKGQDSDDETEDDEGSDADDDEGQDSDDETEDDEGSDADDDEGQDSDDEADNDEGSDAGCGAYAEESDADESGDDGAEADGPTDQEINDLIEAINEAMQAAMGHNDDESLSYDQQQAIQTADQQSAFDEKSERLEGLDIIDKDAWVRTQGQIWGGIPNFVPNESIMSGPLSHLRVVFAENKRKGMTRDLRRGQRLDTRHLHRAGNEDYRIFGRKDQPNKRDWSVVLGVDLTSSNNSNGALGPVKEASMTCAELLSRLGIRFQMEAHTGRGSKVIHMPIKRFDEPWNSKSRETINAVTGSGGNYDGHSMERYRKLAQAERATDKLIMYFTDGAMHGSDEEGEVLLRNVELCRQLGIHLLAVAFNNDSPKDYGFDTVTFSGGQDIASIVAGLDKHLAH